MQAKGKTYLYIAGIFEILLGVLTLGLIFYATSMDNSASIKIFGTYPKDMPSLQLLGIYIQIGLQIIAGLLGICLLYTSFYHCPVCFVAIHRNAHTTSTACNTCMEVIIV